MGNATAREIRRSEKAAAFADKQFADAVTGGAEPNVAAMVEAAYVAGWNESIDDVKQMIDEAEQGKPA